MKILAFDTALTACSVAVVDATPDSCNVLAEHFEARVRGHAEVAAGHVEMIMAAARCGFADLDRIAVTFGPGTFTGVRVGVALARGLGLAAGCPVVGITTLEAIAANTLQAGSPVQSRPIAVAIDARRGEIYLQIFTPALEPLQEPEVVEVALAADRARAHDAVLIGTAAAMLEERTGLDRIKAGGAVAIDQPIASLFAPRAALVPPPQQRLLPLYLRPPDAKLPDKGPVTA